MIAVSLASDINITCDSKRSCDEVSLSSWQAVIFPDLHHGRTTALHTRRNSACCGSRSSSRCSACPVVRSSRYGWRSQRRYRLQGTLGSLDAGHLPHPGHLVDAWLLEIERPCSHSYPAGDVCEESLDAGSSAADFPVWRWPGQSR